MLCSLQVLWVEGSAIPTWDSNYIPTHEIELRETMQNLIKGYWCLTDIKLEHGYPTRTQAWFRQKF